MNNLVMENQEIWGWMHLLVCIIGAIAGISL